MRVAKARSPGSKKLTMQVSRTAPLRSMEVAADADWPGFVGWMVGCAPIQQRQARCFSAPDLRFYWWAIVNELVTAPYQ